MKKRNANNGLALSKTAVTEIHDNFMLEVNGGTTIVGGEETCTGCCCTNVSIRLSAVGSPIDKVIIAF